MGTWHYDWNGNDIFTTHHRVTFDGEWKRFCNRMCAYWYNESVTSTTKFGLDDNVTHKNWYLISYGTPICMVTSHHSELLDNTNWIVYVNEEYYRYSRTTIRQLSDFLKFIGSPCSYIEIKKTMHSTRMHFFYDATIKESVRLYRMNDSEFRRTFNDEVPHYE